MAARLNRHLLVVLPHPDDETFGCAGTILLHTKEGIPVTYLCGTKGEMGRNMGKPVFANRETLPKIREQELYEACRVLGIGDLRFLGLRDKTIEFEDPEVIADKIEEVLREIRPFRVITHYPGQAVHPDHDALGEATIRAIRRLPAEERPEVYAHAITKNREEVLGPPDVVVDIREVVEGKIAAIRAHRSQSEQMFEGLGENAASDPKFRERWGNEVFWRYRF
ncbi:MAG: bacillithiol biosynthesis deacetylase BshB2 [Thermicanus sp.]|nr:bacillithiol biosynthesis deacetylase BshB2 [Thermicanus sp.]